MMNRSKPSLPAFPGPGSAPLGSSGHSRPRPGLKSEAGSWPVPPRPALTRLFLLVLVLFGVSGCGYNLVIDKDEAVKGAWAEVENQYQRRADLVPNLVNVVKG